MKYLYGIGYFVIVSVISASVPADLCDTCVPTQKCPLFGNLSEEEQLSWMKKFPCGTSHRNGFVVPPGFAATAKGDYVCCSNNIWGVENSKQFGDGYKPSSKLIQTNGPGDSNYYTNNNAANHDNNRIKSSYTNNNYDYENTGQLNNTAVWHPDRSQNYENQNYWLNKNRTSIPSNSNRWTNNRNRYWNDRPGREWNSGNHNSNNIGRNIANGNDYRDTRRPMTNIQPRLPNNNFNNDQGSGRSPNNYNPNPSPYYPNNNNNNNYGKPATGTGQCDHLTSFPPDPQSGCCGREAADDDRITGRYPPNFIPPPNNQHWALHRSGKLSMPRDKVQKRAAVGENDTVRVESRISGGKATELYKYPWTVLLLTTFDYGNKQAGFNCGGSLISSKYVLSAGHCVYDKDAVVKSVEANLAEYDKRTFPRDCKVSQSGRNCIENKVMYAETIIIHPQYENENLINDISLIKLQGTAPYTEYIRPICLPTINVDEPQFSNLQFEVAGWGRNGQFTSNVKQSTVLHLVNQNECRRYYPMLTTKHLCAAGYKGEDTCKGDSGGPLMTLYRGRYYATGVVSGKRADSPCGTAVPSLYTNVYHYLDWIRSNIKN